MFYKSLGFLYTNYELWPVYKGERINETINIKDSLNFSRSNPENRFKQYEIPLYGTTYHFTFPYPEDEDLLNNFIEEIPDDHVDISFQIYDKVIDMSGYWFINDYVVGLWKQIVQTFHVIETPEGVWYLLFRRNTNVWRYSDLLDQAAIIMAKDALMGLWNNEKLKYKPSKSAPEEEFPISRDYEMQDPRDKTKRLVIKDNFSIWLRDALLRQMLESWNADPAHTKFQRNTLLQKWQIEYLKRRERRTVALCPRRCLHEDSLVKMFDGTYREAKFVNEGDILCDNKKVIQKGKNKKDCLKITLSNWCSFICSKDHRLPLADNYDNEKWRDLNEDNYRRASEISIWEYLAVFNWAAADADQTSDDYIKWVFYGIQMGDGDRVHHAVTCPQEWLRNYLVNKLSPVFDTYTHKDMIKVRGITKATWTWYAEHNELAKNKYISNEIYGRSSDFKWWILEWLLLTDGYIYVGKPIGNRYWKVELSYNTVSEKLAKGILLLLNDLGIDGYIRQKKFSSNFKSNTNNLCYNVFITHRDSITKIVSNTNLSEKKNYEKLINRLTVAGEQYTRGHLTNIPLIAFSQTKVVPQRWKRKPYYNWVREARYNFARWKCVNYWLEWWLKYFWHKIVKIEEVWMQSVIDFEVDWDHTFIAEGTVQHNSGKSLLMAIEVLTRMLQYNHKKWVRPLTILYLSKDTSTYKTVLDYIDATLAQIGFLKSFFHYDSKAAIYYFRDPVTKQVYSQCKFLTAEGKTPWVGSAADWVFIDEAMMIKPSVFERIFPIVTHEWAGLTVMSTFYDTLEDGDQVYDRPIKLCNEYEKVSSKILDIDSHILKQYDHFVNNGEYPEESVAGLRFTIDDVDVILWKEKIKEDYSVDQDKYMKELYCRAPKKTTAFNFRPRLCTANYDAKEHKRELADKDGVKMIPNYFDTIIISYDPARTTDMSALTTIWYSKMRNKVSVIREQQLNFVDKSSFLTQAELIKEEFARAKGHGHNVYFVMDWSHPWVADALTWAGIPIFRAYRFTWGNQARKGNQYFERHVPKKLMVEALRYLLDNNIVEIWSTCPLTIDQLDKFVEFVNPSTNVSTFQWVQAHDDFVCSLMVWARCLYEDFSFKYWTPQTSSPVDKPAYDIVKPQKPIIQSAYWLNFNFLY